MKRTNTLRKEDYLPLAGQVATSPGCSDMQQAHAQRGQRERSIKRLFSLCERQGCSAPASRHAADWFQFPRDPVRYGRLCEDCFWEMLGEIERHGRTRV
jgi:hypothetical protein